MRPVVDAVIPVAEDPDHTEQPSSALNGRISFVLATRPGVGTVLTIQSGYSKPLRYHARIGVFRDGRPASAPTSTCAVLPGLMVFESWPGAIAAVIITSFEENPDNDTACHN